MTRIPKTYFKHQNPLSVNSAQFLRYQSDKDTTEKKGILENKY